MWWDPRHPPATTAFALCRAQWCAQNRLTLDDCPGSARCELHRQRLEPAVGRLLVLPLGDAPDHIDRDRDGEHQHEDEDDSPFPRAGRRLAHGMLPRHRESTHVWHAAIGLARVSELVIKPVKDALLGQAACQRLAVQSRTLGGRELDKG